MDLTHLLTGNILSQCVDLIGSEKNQEKLKTRIIDPLVSYFKYKLKYFFIVLIVLITCLLIINVVMVVYFVNVRSLLKVGRVVASV